MIKYFHKVTFIIILLSVIYLRGSAQQQSTASVSGVVTSAETNEPLVGCAVVIAELELWATTNDKGYYKIDKIPVEGEYKIETSYLGSEKFEIQFTFSEKKEYTLNIPLREESIMLLNINVTGEEKSGLGSSSKIRETAIEHLQPSSLKDVLQLLPGQVSSNPNLAGPARISIRDIEDDTNNSLTQADANSSLGTAIIVDGAPLTNNADLQNSNNLQANGVDVRQISTDNIVSVEVIKGIASVTYGDMTSGAVIVKTKSGATPWNIKSTLNPNVKKGYIGKGLNLKNNLGALNFDLDYTKSVDSKITPSKGFERVSGQIGYSNTFYKSTTPLSFNIKLKYAQTIDESKKDPDLLTYSEESESSEYSYRMNMFGKWALKKKLVSNINYNLSIDTRNQRSYSNKRITLGYIQPISNARVDTLMEGVYAPSQYYSEMTVKSKPFDVFAQVYANAIYQKNHALNKVTYGFDFRSNGNNGEGKIYDELKPPSTSGGDANRPRPYNEIPFLTQYSLFIEDNLSFPLFGNTHVSMQVGIRYNNFQPDGFFKSKLKTNIEPRFNINYNFIRSKDYSVSVSGGYGIQTKSPTISYLYPNKAYFDLVSFNYFSSNPGERLLLVSTRIQDTEYDEIEPISVTKYETGINGHIKEFDFVFTGYYEKSTNGLDFANQATFLEFNSWDMSDPNIIYPTGEQPVINLEQPTSIDTFIATYDSPRNNQVMIKKGVEYRLDFGELKVIRTSLNINGGYLYTKTYTGSETYLLPNGNGADQLPYVGVYASNMIKERIRFNSNFVGITHIPNLRLIFTTTLQVIWKNSMKRSLSNGQPWGYTYSETNYLVKAPTALIGKDGIRHEMTKEEILQPEYDYYLTKYNEKYFYTENLPVHYQLNLKVTSEIGSAAKLSFFANNVTMYNPRYRSKRTDSVEILNSPLYFGLELTFLL